MEEKFSVSMCVYGKDDPAHFGAAVESVLNQTRRPDEVVLVVDGPIPEDMEHVVSCCEQEPIFKVIRLDENQGHGTARRIGLEQCSHPLVALMDADDICVPERFALQLAYFVEHPQCSIVGGQIVEFIESVDQPVGKRIVPLEDVELKRYMKKRCPFNQVTVMFQKQAVDTVGGYIDWFCEEDYYLWLRMALAGMTFGNLPEILVKVRVGRDMYQRRGGWKYFRSEAKLQNYMRRQKLISLPLYVANVAKRLIVQVLMPNRLRAWAFQHFARE